MSAWLTALRGSGPCVDSPTLLGLLAPPGRLRSLGLSVLRLKFTPLVLERIRDLTLPLEEKGELFSQGVSLLNAGGSFKTTGQGRTRLADAAVLRRAAGLDAPRIAEVGVSDGSASLRLLAALPQGTGLQLTDRTPAYHLRGGWCACLVLDSAGELLGLKLPGLYLCLPLGLHLSTAKARRVDTLNPLLKERHGITAIQPFDALADRLPEPAQIIKCANVLNLSYFSDAQVRAAVANLGRSLVDGGHLIISQNNARYEGGEAYFVLERRGPEMVLVEEQGGHEALELFQEARN